MAEGITDNALLQVSTVSQVVIILLLYGTSFIVHRIYPHYPRYLLGLYEYRADPAKETRTLGGIVTVLLCITMVLLFFAEGHRGWRAALQFGEWMLLSNEAAIKWTVFANLAVVSLLIFWTGPSPSNPFTPVHFLLPPLSIFLGLETSEIVLVLAFVLVHFTFVCWISAYSREDVLKSLEKGHLAYWIASVTCFSLATYVGLITRSVLR